MTTGFIFDEQNMSSADHAMLVHLCAGRKSGVVYGCGLTYDASAAYVAAGAFLAHGRGVRVLSTETIAAPEIQSGTFYASLVYTVDLSQTNTAEQFNQGYWEWLTNANGYPTPTQEDLDDGGTTYQMLFAHATVTASGITAFSAEVAPYDSIFETLTAINHIVIPASGWTGSGPYTQNVSIANMREAAYPDWDLDKTTDDDAIEQFPYITFVEAFNGYVTITCRNDCPTVNIPMILKGV